MGQANGDGRGKEPIPFKTQVLGSAGLSARFSLPGKLSHTDRDWRRLQLSLELEVFYVSSSGSLGAKASFHPHPRISAASCLKGFPSDLETDSNFVSSLLPVSLWRLLALCLGWKWLGSSLSDLEGAGRQGRVGKGECSGGCLSHVSEKGT